MCTDALPVLPLCACVVHLAKCWPVAPLPLGFTLHPSPVVVVHDVPALRHGDLGTPPAVAPTASPAVGLLKHLNERLLSHLTVDLPPLRCLLGWSGGWEGGGGVQI